ncbi:MAG TPA: hypothetical protein PLB89_13765 [Flavobacteriales bacterium]|nr:hypothetical protein [Flavobacteriales bacterium]
MKAIALPTSSLLVMFLFPAWCAGQNLVPNPSFEEYTECPDDLGQLGRVVGWDLFYGSPEYFNTCSPNPLTSVPNNAFGYQAAFDGEGYIGCYTYAAGPFYRECVQAELLAPLTPGVPVHLSMALSAGGYSTNKNYSLQRASNRMGIRFSTVPVTGGSLITDGAVLFMEPILQDTAEWVVLSMSYTPDSAYRYIQVGNFFTDQMTDLALLDPNAATDGAYAFVDGLCVSETSGVCLLSDGVQESTNSGALFGYIQNAELVVNLQGMGSSAVSMDILDGMGRLCWRGTSNPLAQYRIALSSFAPGLYHLVAGTSTGGVRHLKFFYYGP